MNNSVFISPEKAYEKYQSGKVIFIDATYGSPIDYTIPDAIYFDIDDIADLNSPMAHMLPSPEIFAERVGALGVTNDSEIIVFDKTGFWMAASRVWWMFRAFEHDDIKILNGGLPHWPGDLEPYKPKQKEPKIFAAKYRDFLVTNFDGIQKAKKENKDFVIIDARPDMAFLSGHIENSISIPLPKIITDNGCLKPLSELHHILLPAAGKKIITSCGSGVTACTLAAALHECGYKDVSVYDGSWSEYAKLKAS